MNISIESYSTNNIEKKKLINKSYIPTYLYHFHFIESKLRTVIQFYIYQKHLYIFINVTNYKRQFQLQSQC
jgi:hypothetical protein